MAETTELIISSIFIVASGCILHFLYSWSHEKKWVAVFAAVNESVWEHLKIAMVPAFIWMVYDLCVHGANPNIWIATAVSILAMMLIMVIVFYGYKIFTKHAILWLDILIFIIAIVLGRVIFYAILNLPDGGLLGNIISGVVISAIFVAVILLSFYPPKCTLFLDPQTKKYGLAGHNFKHHQH